MRDRSEAIPVQTTERDCFRASEPSARRGQSAEIDRLVRAILAACMLVLATTAAAQDLAGCGSFLNTSFGPFDYRDPEAKGPLQLVEPFHFTRDVEQLVRGKSGSLMNDLDYTLRVFPNHPRALVSVSRYALSGGDLRYAQDKGTPSVECYFERAIAFRPDDEVVRMIYATHLNKRGRRESARDQYEEALRLAPASAEVNYNVGLFYIEEGDIIKAKQSAKVAYEGGYPLLGLKKKIEAAEAENQQ